MTQNQGGIGSSFEDYLATQGTLEETRAVAVKHVLAWQIGAGHGEKADEEEGLHGSGDADESEGTGPDSGS